ncbi:hypothetical protein C8J56DRAFT_801090, partial [Mycena floridula]
SASQKRALIASYNAMLKHTPELGPYLQHLQDTEDTESFHDLITHLQDFASKARTADTNTIKNAIISYLPADPSTDIINPPLVPGRSKANRGVNHAHIAALFCPRKHMARMLTCSEDAYDLSLQDGNIALNSKQLPAFLYDWDMFDPEDPEIGLFHGHISVRVTRAIFTSPSSALTGVKEKASRQSNGQIHRSKKMTAPMVAYSVVQAYFALCAQESWRQTDGEFNIKMFYKRILDLLNDPDDIWATDTLKWWTR